MTGEAPAVGVCVVHLDRLEVGGAVEAPDGHQLVVDNGETDLDGEGRKVRRLTLQFLHSLRHSNYKRLLEVGILKRSKLGKEVRVMRVILVSLLKSSRL